VQGINCQNVKEKKIPTLKKYFQSTQNVDDESPIAIPSYVSCSLLHFSLGASFSINKDDLLSTYVHSNHVLH